MSARRLRPLYVLPLALLSTIPLLGVDRCGPQTCTSDQDGDGVCDEDDACPGADDAVDADQDGAPDACDLCPADASDDGDGDGVCDGAPAMTVSPLPATLSILQRDGNDRAVVRVQGTVLEPGYDGVVLDIDRDGTSWMSMVFPLSYTGDAADFAIAAELEAGLHNYDLRLSVQQGDQLKRVSTRTSVAVGDLVLIQGQSNAVAADYHAENLANQSRSPWIRSFGSASTDPAAAAADLTWGTADGVGYYAHATVGAWGLRMAELLVQQANMPIGLLNGAVGGTYIAQHQRNDANPEDLNTIYGRFLYRARRSGFAADARYLIWYQGESDGNGLGPSSTAALYPAGFDALRQDWKQDFPALERIYTFQVRYGCGLDHPTDGWLALLFYDAANTAVGGQLIEFWSDPSWNQYKLAGVAPANTAYMVPWLVPVGYGAVQYDDASLKATGGPELLLNTGFESGTTAPADWLTSGTGSYTWSNGVAHTGSRSMRLESGASTALLYQVIPASGGQNYEASVWTKAEYTGAYYDVREALRTLPARYGDVTVMSTNAAPGHDGCHFYYAGYRELGDRISRLVLRDFYGSTEAGIDAPEVTAATWIDDRTLQLTLKDGADGLSIDPGAWIYFRIGGAYVTGATVAGGGIRLTLNQPTTATKLSYTDHSGDAADIVNGRGIGLLSFVDLPISRP